MGTLHQENNSHYGKGKKTNNTTNSSTFKTLVKKIFPAQGDHVTYFFITSFITDIVLINASFFLLYYIRFSTFKLSSSYGLLLLFLHLFWILTAILTRKFSIQSHCDVGQSISTSVRAILSMTYTLCFVVVMFDLFKYSRAHVFGTCLLYGILECSFIAAYFVSQGESILAPCIQRIKKKKALHNLSARKVIADFILISGAFLLLNYWKRNTIILTTEYHKGLLLIYSIWLVTSLYTGKFSQRHYPDFLGAIAPYTKSWLLGTALLSMVVFFFRLSFYSRLQLFGTLGIVLIAEILLYWLYGDHSSSKDIEDIETIEQTSKVFQAERLLNELIYDQESTLEKATSAKEKVKQLFLSISPKVFSFIHDHIDIENIPLTQCAVVKSNFYQNKIDLASILHFSDNGEKIDGQSEKSKTLDLSDTLYMLNPFRLESVKLFINTHRINDIRRINRYFLEIHKKCHLGGYFVGHAETFHTRHQRIFAQYPSYIAHMVYALDFLIFRVLPKIPLIQSVYFSISRGENRVLSQAEILGRLYFCGFEVISVQEINNHFYFIARKIKEPSIDVNPSYGPIIKLRRIGYQGKIIQINKLRTMHPYSEYLQEYIHKNYKLQSSGKFNNDFRVTTWGKIFRQLWIDELPQLANYFRGDIVLVGVRAISEHYFSLYPEYLQGMRTQFYPGLIPPYYADMPKSFAEIIQSEKKYLERKKLAPYTTDVCYLTKALYNIFFKKARSM